MNVLEEIIIKINNCETYGLKLFLYCGCSFLIGLLMSFILVNSLDDDVVESNCFDPKTSKNLIEFNDSASATNTTEVDEDKEEDEEEATADATDATNAAAAEEVLEGFIDYKEIDHFRDPRLLVVIRTDLNTALALNDAGVVDHVIGYYPFAYEIVPVAKKIGPNHRDRNRNRSNSI